MIFIIVIRMIIVFFKTKMTDPGFVTKGVMMEDPLPEITESKTTIL